MDDEKIRNIFINYRPEISSDFKFMKKLEQNLNSVEIIRQHNAEIKAKNRKAVVIAAIAGFIVGFFFSMSLPYLENFIAEWELTLPDKSVMKVLADYFMLIAWIIIGAATVFTSLNTYEAVLKSTFVVKTGYSKKY